MIEQILLLQNHWTPLHYSANSGHVSVVELLVRFGADFTAIDEVSYIGTVYLQSDR